MAIRGAKSMSKIRGKIAHLISNYLNSGIREDTSIEIARKI